MGIGILPIISLMADWGKKDLKKFPKKEGIKAKN